MKFFVIFLLVLTTQVACDNFKKKPEPAPAPVIEPIPEPAPEPKPEPAPEPAPVMKYSCLSLGEPVQFATLEELKEKLSKKYPDTCLRVDNQVVVMGFGPCYSCRSINK